MTYTPTRLVNPTVLPLTETLLYGPVPVGSAVQLRSITATNTSAAPLTFDLSLVSSGGTAGTGNRILSGITVNASDVFDWTDLEHVLNPGEFLSGLASGSGMNLTISGWLET